MKEKTGLLGWFLNPQVHWGWKALVVFLLSPVLVLVLIVAYNILSWLARFIWKQMCSLWGWMKKTWMHYFPPAQ